MSTARFGGIGGWRGSATEELPRDSVEISLDFSNTVILVLYLGHGIVVRVELPLFSHSGYG